MDNHARASSEHHRQEPPIQTRGREQVEVKGASPFVIVEHGEPTRRRGRAARNMDDDVRRCWSSNCASWERDCIVPRIVLAQSPMGKQ